MKGVSVVALVLIGAGGVWAQERETLVIRSPEGETTAKVSVDDVVQLERLETGDKLRISVRDARSGERRVLGAVVSTPMAAEAERAAAQRQGEVVEVVSTNADTRTLTVRETSGRTRTILVDEKAVVAFKNLGPGEKVLMSWRFDRDGQPEAVFRIEKEPGAATTKTLAIIPTASPRVSISPSRNGLLDRADRTPTLTATPEGAAITLPASSSRVGMNRRFGESYTVVSVDAEFGTLVIQDGFGAEETLAVERDAVAALRRLSPGDRVTLAGGTAEGSRVTVIANP